MSRTYDDRTALRPDTGVARATGARVAAAMETAIGWLERYRQRRALQALPDHLLHDIGISRIDAEREADKPFWRD